QPQRASHKILSPPCTGAEGAPSARYARCARYSISMEGRHRRVMISRKGRHRRVIRGLPMLVE
ncbi:hypothetical protein, partial [Rathayibacter sp. VKM Ac-2926]|uniref:hypothetical protein n=1 Tax=Rathayibacter sp. VKM Ac-2926 TaxID=2929477 RepID=UPI001FB41B17